MTDPLELKRYIVVDGETDSYGRLYFTVDSPRKAPVTQYIERGEAKKLVDHLTEVFDL